MRNMKFEELLAPVSVKNFFEKYYEKAPLILQKRPTNLYENLISPQDLNFLLATSPITDQGWIRVTNDQEEQRLENYSQKINYEFLSFKTLFKENVKIGLTEGDTYILNALQLRWEPIRCLASMLEENIGHPISVNAYYSPENSQGFQAHYDTHDVFILQLQGEKLWKIYDQVASFPIGEGDSRYHDPLPTPTHEIYLKEGDLIYLPRGFVHEVLTTNSHSLHLTVGIYAFTWCDLIREMALQESQLRKALPVRILSEDSSEKIKGDDLETMRKICDDSELIALALQKLKEKFKEGRSPSLYNWK